MSNSVPLPRVLQAGSAGQSAPSPLETEVVELFDELREPLLRYLFSFGISAPDGEEIIQDAFLALFQHLQKGKSRANLRGWLFRVAHNQALKKRYRSRRESPLTETQETVGDSAPTPESEASGTQIQNRVLAVVNALPEQDRRCLALRAEGLRYREIAEVLGMSLGSVSQSLTRCLARVSRAAGW